MATTAERLPSRPLHPVVAALLAGMVPLFVGAWVADLAYVRTYEIQWANFASWLITGGLLVGAVVLVAAIVGVLRGRRRGRELLYLVVLLAMAVLGFLDALVHARDGWAAMPAGLWLSATVAVLSIVATWLGFSARGLGGAP